jgi:hypothetical protein
MSNEAGLKAFETIMSLVYEQEAQSGRFKQDVQQRSSGMMQRQGNAPEKVKYSDTMDASQDTKNFIAGYVREIQNSFNKGAS